MKNTAVEFLVQKLSKEWILEETEFAYLIDRAKEMEKEQIFQAYSIGFSNGAASFYITPIDYYKHTFKS